MSKVCGGGSWAGSGCDREAGREASMADVPKDCVRAMVAMVGVAIWKSLWSRAMKRKMKGCRTVGLWFGKTLYLL
jgi:hypothetical protein